MFDKNKENNKDIPLYGIVDERTKSVVNQGDAYSARFMLFAVLIDIMIRGLNLNTPIINNNWDLMLIVIVGGLISTAYQIKSHVLFSRPFGRSFFYITLLITVSAIIAVIIMLFLASQ